MTASAEYSEPSAAETVLLSPQAYDGGDVARVHTEARALYAQLQGRLAFDRLGSGTASVCNPEGQIVLPPALVQGMQTAWDGSLPSSVAQEQGGILVREPNGTYGWKAGPAGTADAFTPNYGDLGADETLVGVGHTHPYAADEGGHTNVSFSGGDLARLVLVPDNLAIVQSGETSFVAARTQEFDALIENLDDAGRTSLFHEINDFWNDAYTGHSGTLPQAAEAATRLTCNEYHLLYYRGQGSTLNRIDTSHQP